MANKPLVSIILPCFNEGARIGQVVDQVIQISQPKEIIIVDDGSNSDTKKALADIKGEIKIITHPHNLGKSQALMTGIKASLGQIIMFVDADIVGITPAKLEALINPIKNNQADMVIGVRQNDVSYSNIYSFNAAYAGERAFSRQELLDNIDVFKCSRYNIEASINRRYFSVKRVSKVLLLGVSQVAKCQKEGFKGLINSFKMLAGIIKYLGLREFFNQLFYISHLNFTSEV